MYLKKSLNSLNSNKVEEVNVFDNLFDLLKNPFLIRLSFFQYKQTLQNRKKKLLFNRKSFSLLINNSKHFYTFFGLPSIEVSILIEEIKLILKAIYEPVFFTLNLNYSFKNFLKPNQKLLNMFLYQMSDLNTIFEISLTNEFNDFDPKTFIRVLNQRIIDRDFLKFIYVFIRFSLFYQYDFYLKSFKGNNGFFEEIVFLELDKFINAKTDFLLNSFNKFKITFVVRLINKLGLKTVVYDEKLLIKNYFLLLEQKRFIGKRFFLFSKKVKLFYIKQRMLYTSKNMLNTFVPKLYYFRYANVCYFFLYSESVLSFLIKNKLIFYIEKFMNFDLKLLQFQIGNISKIRINFWGFYIKSLDYKKGFSKNYFELNNHSLKYEFKSLGFLKKVKGKIKPSEVSSWAQLSDYEIILKYNCLVRGLVHYFSFIIKHRLLLKFFIYVLEYSCYKTFSQKHRSTIRKLRSKYGEFMFASIIRKNKELKIIQTVTLLNTKNYWNFLQSVLDFSFMFNSNV